MQVASCLGFVVVLMDVSVVNVALEALHAAFRAGMSGLQWVVNAYTLAFAALLLTAGALGDRVGARPVFMAGFALFTLASLGCGLAPGLDLLNGARFVQGIGAALLVPNSLSLLRQAFHDPEERNRAVGWWGAGGGIALAAGPVVGGLLIAVAGWRAIFLVNLPIGVLGLWLTARHAPASPKHPRRGLDLAGQIAAALALSGLTMALTEASGRGWTDPVVGAGLVAAGLLGALFLRLEAGNPSAMLPAGPVSGRDAAECHGDRADRQSGVLWRRLHAESLFPDGPALFAAGDRTGLSADDGHAGDHECPGRADRRSRRPPSPDGDGDGPVGARL
ncbi:major facilitator transporter [Gluconacetobacter sacchari DSM 12717]|uniref:Major facilitator transporter n=1 Tax=Gluconacetobacter sacchari DSM 12717 TaxID=1307940 RepID=A0ABQ0P225_9PROT|nr:major facilitator transporter [Gluconacetobacter sacchari DSM 12717]